MHTQVINSLLLKAKASGTKVKFFNKIDDLNDNLIKESYAIMIQNPTTEGELLNTNQVDMTDIVKIGGVDVLSLCLIEPPTHFDITYGSVNRFGLGLAYGGPHAGFLSCKKEFVRYIPGRIVTEAEDKYGIKGLRLGLQTREQHIKKEGALSNICTAQSLPAVISTAYAMYHGKEGLINMAQDVNNKANKFSKLYDDTLKLRHTNFFDTVAFTPMDSYAKNTFLRDLIYYNIEFNIGKDYLGFSFDEVNKEYNDFDKILHFEDNIINNSIPNDLKRKTTFLEDDIFDNMSELELTRYYTQLADKDYSLTTGMIPLGSCTMKHTSPWSLSLLDHPLLNIHPYTKEDNKKGYNELFTDLTDRFNSLIGLPVWFYQSQSGAMGEFSALYTINNFYKGKRKTILIPDNAHGTNFTSASLAGFNIEKIITTNGEIDLEFVDKLIKEKGDDIAAIMITYPSTYGFFDDNIKDVIKRLKENGSKIYLDGANMNALVGVKRLDELGVDICHLNLHKTFSIPHGGGGPGMGPIGLTNELKPYLPKDPLEGECISGHKYGSGSLCAITWSYLCLLDDDIKHCTLKAIDNSNYIKKALEKDFKILFTDNKACSHEFLIDTIQFNKKGYNDNYISKRLMDYGFHAPTISWPVKNVLMIEPTETEPKQEMDRFILAMKMIKEEMDKYKLEESPLYNSPHTQRDIINWQYKYSIEEGCYPMGFSHNKFWPSINKLDEGRSDRNLLKKD